VSEENVGRTRRALEAFNARDIEALLGYFDPRIEWRSTFASVGGGVYHGHDGIRQWLGDLRDAWGDEIRNEPEALFDLAEQTLVFSVLRGRGRQSGAEVAMAIAHVARWRDGLCVYYKAYAGRDEALRDLGVSRHELEPIAP
jgi:ketosteroid isomerase-like protein